MASQLSAASHTFAIEESTVAQLQSAMASGEITAADLVAYYTARIEQLDSRLNAFISVDEKALDVAAQLDEERANGELRGALHGIPVVIKDNINTADLPTTGGCAALADLQPSEDAFVVARLREAGAIVLGKANLHELACSGESVSSLGGQVRNPYSLDYTPGGSSGGTAVAIAANLAVCGLGSDAVNSVRSPASACSIVGLRPTSGRVSRRGLMSVTLTQDVIGPMGRSVADVATLLDVISIDDPEDPMTARGAGHPMGQLSNKDGNSYQSALTLDGLAGKRLGVVPSLWGDGEVHAAVNQVVDEAISAMKSLGAQVVEMAVNIDIDRMLAELSLNTLEGKLHLNQYLESCGATTPVKTLKELLEIGKETGAVHPSVIPVLEKMEAVDTPLGNHDYWQRLYPRRVELRQLLTHLFQRYQIDALIYPHQRQPVARVGESQKERNGFLAAACGFPAITFPAGFVSMADAELPVGIELMSQPFEESKLLQMAYAYEQHAHTRRKPELSEAKVSESESSESGASETLAPEVPDSEAKVSEAQSSKAQSSKAQSSKAQSSKSSKVKGSAQEAETASSTDKKTTTVKKQDKLKKTDEKTKTPKPKRTPSKRTKSKEVPPSADASGEA
ncbi:MAG: amidase [Phormidesmis sp.]